jgi:hypothetical protein
VDGSRGSNSGQYFANRNLGNWLSGPGIAEVVSVRSIENARETVVWKEILPDLTPARFLRLRVEPVPP